MSAVQNDRRLEVAEAAWRVIVREGLDRTSLRAIAHEMNCTTGVVTHYFRNKQELILFALHQVTARLQARMEAAMVGGAGDGAGIDRFVAMLSSFLPVDQEGQDILRVWAAFLGYAVGREDLMTNHRHSAEQLRQAILKELETLQQQHSIRMDLDLESEANILLALVNGLSLDSLIQSRQLSLEQQTAVIRRYIENLA